MSEVCNAPRPANQYPTLRSALRKVSPSMVVPLGYLLIGFAAFWPVLPWDFAHHLYSGTGDYWLSVWFLGWVPHALAHGLNPFFSNAILVPTGVNLAQNTESPLLGLVAAPFTLTFGPVVSANLLMVLAMPASATAAFVVLRKWRVWGPAAALGGLIYGFSPYMVGQSLAHVELLFVPLPPFIAFTVASILQRRGSPRRLGIQLGLLVAAQYLIEPEVCAVVAIFTIAAVACVAIRDPTSLPQIVRPAGIALGVTAVLLAYPIWLLLAGPQHFTGAATPIANPYHNDLLSFVVPGPLQRVPLGMRSLGTRLVGSRPDEAGGYLGVPLLILTGILAWYSRRSPRMQLAVLLLVGAALLSLGPYLAVDGRLTHIPLPFLLLDHLPLLNDILPMRIGFEIGACLAAVIAFGVDDMHRAPARGHRHGGPISRGRVFAGITLAVLVATQLPQWPHATPPSAVALPAILRRAVPAGDPVTITYPYGTAFTMQPMLWQAEEGYGFRLLGGYAYHPDASGGPSLYPSVMHPPNLQRFLAGQDLATSFFFPLYGPSLPVSPELVATTRTALSKYDVRLVIVDRSAGGSGPVMELFNDALGPPKLSAGQFSLWKDWHGPPSHQVFPVSNLSTNILTPASDARVSGAEGLDAVATGDLQNVTRVEFLLTDGSEPSKVIAVARPSFYGWIAKWNTASVANGTYTLQSVAYDSAGRKSQSKGVTITVNN
jgi:Bacterial Ig domain